MRPFSRFGSGAVAALAASILAWSGAFAVEARAEASVSVLCYHSFLEKKKMDQFSFTIDELNSQIAQLKKEGFRFVSINDVIGGRLSGTKNVLITIDDGNKSVYEAYRKVFRPNGIRPLLGIYPNIIINKKHYALTWEQLTELANGGCDIAAHGYFHLKINKKLNDKNPGYFKKEIFLVKKVLEEKLNRKITVFVYPFGLRDELTIKTLREAGYRYAFTINNGRIDIPLSGGDRPFELPRYMVTRNSWKYCFNSVVRNARHKVAYRVASAGGDLVNKADMAAMERPPSERHDPAAELTARLAERMDKASMTAMKTEKKDKLAKDSGTKKKIEKKTGIGSDAAPKTGKKALIREDKSVREREQLLAMPDDSAPDVFPPESKEKNRAVEHKSPKKANPDFLAEERRLGMALPIRRAANSVKRDPSESERPDIFSVKRRHASFLFIDGSPADRHEPAANETGERGGTAALEARVEKGKITYLSGMKKQYNGINSKSVRTYHGVMGMVGEKIERIKHSIRKYVLSHF